MFPHMGAQEIIIILAIALVLFGPKKLPEIGRSLGHGLRELKKASREVMDSIDGIARDDDPAPEPAWKTEPNTAALPAPAAQATDDFSDRVTHSTDEGALEPASIATNTDSEPAPEQAKEITHNAADSRRNA